MRFEERRPVREFSVGAGDIVLRDCGTLRLEADEQVTFVTPTGGEYDVVRKEWGFYATPSVNGRLAQFGLRAVLVRNDTGLHYVLIVEQGREDAFFGYLHAERMEVVTWLDSTAALGRVGRTALGEEDEPV